MTTAEALASAWGAGINVAVDGADLLLDAAAEPPRAVLEAMSLRKQDIIRMLGNKTGWTAEEIRISFEERSAIREFDGGLGRAEADRMAAHELCMWINATLRAPVSNK